MIENIARVKAVVKELKATRGKNAKLLKLEFMKDRDVAFFFKLCLDTSVTYGYSEMPKGLPIKAHDSDFNFFMQLVKASKMQSLKEKKDEIRYLASVASDAQKWALNRIIKRKPDCGIGLKEVAKIWPDLIREQAYMGLKSESKAGIDRLFAKAKKTNTPVIWQEKYPGTHLIIEGSDKGIKSISRQGEPVAVPKGITWHLLQLLGEKSLKNMYLAGEALILKEDGSYEEEAVGNGIINAGYVKNMEIRIFDLVPYSVAYGEDKAVPYLERLRTLSLLIEKYTDKCAYVGERPIFKLVRNCFVSSQKEARDLSDKVIAQGGEGGVVLLGSGTWSKGKPSWRYKQKYEQEVDAMILGWYPHKQKPHLIGGFECLVKGGSMYDYEIKFNVGSGLTDKIRESDPKRFIGTTCTVCFTDITKAKNAKALSLKNPRLEDVDIPRHPECTFDVFNRYKLKTGRVHPLASQ